MVEFPYKKYGREGDSMEGKLLEFLHRARRMKYAQHTPSSQTTLADGAYLYRDSRLGDGSFAGQESLWEDGRPVWAMNYAGRALSSDLPMDFLREALLEAPVELPWPGPAEYAKEPYAFRCAVQGEPAWFYGYAEVLKADVRIFEYAFHGGALRGKPE